LFRREYRLPNFFSVKPHARRTIQLWNVTLIGLLMLGFLARISVQYSRGWIVLFYITTLAALIVLRYVIVRITALARSAGLLSAQRIFLIGTGENVGAFVNRYEPWALGINVVGCRFLTPVAGSAPAEVRNAMLDRDLAEAVASVRSLAPDAVFVLLPWSATETIERCAETFLALPVEIHLGPDRSCTSSTKSNSRRSDRSPACRSRVARCRASRSSRSGCSISLWRRRRCFWRRRCSCSSPS
jgi:FlaA1/EpsC-like NDP-sugar epimerase